MNGMYEGLREETVAYLKVRKMALEAARAGDGKAVRYWAKLMTVHASGMLESR